MCFRVSGSILNPGAKNLIKHLNDILMISRLEKSSPDMKRYRLTDLPQAAQDGLLKTRVLKNASEYRKQFAKNTEVESLFAGFGGDADETVTVDPIVEETRIIWATDSYEDREINPQDVIELDQVLHIIPRSEKAKEEQKKRTKAKAEVFTPSWVCCMQNNLVDDCILYDNAFIFFDYETKTWTPNPEKVDFTKSNKNKGKTVDHEDYYTWMHYVIEKRLEITCGEAPYLVSRYDTVTGEDIPVRNANGVFQRIGLLDRKFRVIHENIPVSMDEVKTKKHREMLKEWWLLHAYYTLDSIYGFEWQGDSLLLARLNILNSFVDYYRDVFDEVPADEVLIKIADIISWQVWQMDGLKMVTPLSCELNEENTGEKCEMCESRKNKVNHLGKPSVINWSGRVVVFEDMLRND